MEKVRFNPKKHCGYFICKRLNKVIYVSINAIADNQQGFICACGNWTKLDPFYHSGMVSGERI